MADLDDIKDGKDFRTDQPQKNIPFTLKGCGALDWGMQSRLSRIFNPKTGKTVMLAFDHGYFQGPTTGLERIDINIAPLFEHADVLMCTRGILRSVVPPATNKPVVLRASGANSILAELSNEAVALSMDDAVRLNSCAVAAQVYIGSEYEHQSIKNIIQLVDAGMKVGMPTMAVTGVGKDMVRDQRYFSLATSRSRLESPLKWGRKLSKPIMSKKVLNGLLPDVRYPLLLLAVKNYRSARRWKCAGRLSIRALLVWIWGVIFSSLTIRWR